MCGACSKNKFLLPSQSSKPLRVCDPCYKILTNTTAENGASMVPGKKRPLSTVHELPEERPPRPPPPKLFPQEQQIHDQTVEFPPVPLDEPELKISARPPKLYELVQLSQTDSFDMEDVPQRGFMRQNSSSFWWDANDDHIDTIEVTEDLPSFVSATIYTEGKTRVK